MKWRKYAVAGTASARLGVTIHARPRRFTGTEWRKMKLKQKRSSSGVKPAVGQLGREEIAAVAPDKDPLQNNARSTETLVPDKQAKSDRN